MDVYLFGWPSNLGGASTKIYHTVLLLTGRYRVTMVAETAARLADVPWRRFLESRGVRCSLLQDLPRRLNGWGLAICKPGFFANGILAQARERGLKIAWSNEMMFFHPGELGAVMLGLVDVILFVSDAQRAALGSGYAAALGASPEPVVPGITEGRIGRQMGVRWVTTGHYIDPDWFPFRDRWRGARRRIQSGLIVGRLSRADPDKYPDDFPHSYERLELRAPRFRVMAWSPELRNRWPDYRFGRDWELLPAMAEPQAQFLRSLDLFVYQLSPRFLESWGRAVVEASLTGAISLVPKGGGHHLQNLVWHGVTGFHCENDSDYRHHAQRVQEDPELRRKMSRAARDWSAATLCDRKKHLELWEKVFR